MTQPPIDPQGNPGQNWQGQQPQGGYPQQGYQQQPPPKKKFGCMKIGLIILGVLILLAIIMTAVSGGDDEGPTVSSSDESSQDSTDGTDVDSGVTFQGKTDKDTAANAGDTITKDGVATVSSPLTVETNPLGESQLCTTVTIKNDSDEQVSFNTLDWNLQNPNGASMMSTFGGSGAALSSGQLAPGGQTSGDVCFDGNPSAMPGEYIVINDGYISFSSDRLAWVNTL